MSLQLCLIHLSLNITQNAELFAMTYGALVVQLIQDYEDYAEVNKQLDKMGYNIGTRLIEDFLARSNIGRCADFRDTGEVIAKVRIMPYSHTFLPLWVTLKCAVGRGREQVGFKSFLNVTPTVVHSPQAAPSSSSRSSTPAGQAAAAAAAAPPQQQQPYFTLTLDENPLTEFVELPEDAIEGGLWFSNVLCGVLRGALEMVRSFIRSGDIFTSDRRG